MAALPVRGMRLVMVNWRDEIRVYVSKDNKINTGFGSSSMFLTWRLFENITQGAPHFWALKLKFLNLHLDVKRFRLGALASGDLAFPGADMHEVTAPSAWGVVWWFWAAAGLGGPSGTWLCWCPCLLSLCVDKKLSLVWPISWKHSIHSMLPSSKYRSRWYPSGHTHGNVWSTLLVEDMHVS